MNRPKRVIRRASKGKIDGPQFKIINYQKQFPWLKEACPISPDTTLQHVARFLTGLVEPNPRVLKTHLYGEETPFGQILARWDRKALLIRKKMGKAFLDDYMAFRSKAGPRSVMHAWTDVRDVYTGYFQPVQCDAAQDKIDSAVDFIMRYTGLASYIHFLRPLTIDEAIKRLPKTTNWGMPWYLHGIVLEFESLIVDGTKILTGQFKVKEDHIPMYRKLAIAMSTDTVHEGWSLPNLPFRRTDNKGPEIEDVAQRAVWGQPHSVSILDATIVGPITKLVQKIKAPGFYSLINEEELTLRIHSMLREAESRGMIVVGLDKDKWDHHVSRKWIYTAFDRIGKMFQVDALPSYYDNLIRYFINSNMLTPDGLLTGRLDNVSSGSGFTLWINGFIHLIVLAYVYFELNGTFEGFEAEAKGDDAVIILREDQVAKFVEITNTQTGMINSLVKQWTVPGTTSFAKKVYRLDIPAGVPPSSRTVNSMIFPDQGVDADVWTGYWESARLISQCSNYWGTPEFKALVDFAIKGDMYGLGTTTDVGVDEILRRAGGPEILNRLQGNESFEHIKGINWNDAVGDPTLNYLRNLESENR